MCKTYDFCGIFLAVFTVFLLLFGNFVCNYFCIFYWYYEPNPAKQLLYGIPLTGMGTVYALTFNYLCVMSLSSHWRAAWADPGIVAKQSEPPGNMDPARVKMCKKCDNSWKPERAHHCSECGNCIFKMDHHCPWINNCVGVKNLKYFMLFIIYTGLSAAYLCLMLILSFYHLMTAKSKVHQQKDGYMLAFVMCVIGFIEGILFTFFCFELVQEQFESIGDNQTYVDDMKETFGRPQALVDNLFQSLGEDWTWWLIPTHPVLNINYFEKLYTIKQLKKLREFEEDEYDDSHKERGVNMRKAWIEKKILIGLVALSTTAWFGYMRYEVQSRFIQ
eukprot:403370469